MGLRKFRLADQVHGSGFYYKEGIILIKANVKFFGGSRDPFGMPIPYHSYLIVSSPWQQAGSGVASVISLTANAPLPDSPHKLVLTGGPEKAYEEALSSLRNLQQNKNLTELVDIEGIS